MRPGRKRSQSHISQPGMIVRPAAQRPVKLPLGFFDWQILNAGKAPLHETLRI